jgi:hypothetical protein
VRESRTLRLTWRGLETWPWWNCAPIPQSKERDRKPSTYSRRACPRPYRWGAGRKGRQDLARSLPYLLRRSRFQQQVSPGVDMTSDVKGNLTMSH